MKIDWAAIETLKKDLKRDGMYTLICSYVDKLTIIEMEFLVCEHDSEAYERVKHHCRHIKATSSLLGIGDLPELCAHIELMINQDNKEFADELIRTAQNLLPKVRYNMENYLLQIAS